MTAAQDGPAPQRLLLVSFASLPVRPGLTPPLSWDTWLSAQSPPRSRWRSPDPVSGPSAFHMEMGEMAGQMSLKPAWLGRADSRPRPHQAPGQTASGQRHFLSGPRPF